MTPAILRPSLISLSANLSIRHRGTFPNTGAGQRTRGGSGSSELGVAEESPGSDAAGGFDVVHDEVEAVP